MKIKGGQAGPALHARPLRRYILPMHRDIDRVLISQEQIAQRVAELARMITEDHSAPKLDRPAQVTIVPILTGAMIFCADLIRQIPIAMRIGVVSVSSYPGQSVTSQGAQ